MEAHLYTRSDAVFKKTKVFIITAFLRLWIWYLKECWGICMDVYIGFKTFFYVVQYLDSVASYLPTSLHLGFFHSWPSLFLSSSFSLVFLMLSLVLASTSMLFWAIWLYIHPRISLLFYCSKVQHRYNENLWSDPIPNQFNAVHIPTSYWYKFLYYSPIHVPDSHLIAGG